MFPVARPFLRECHTVLVRSCEKFDAAFEAKVALKALRRVLRFRSLPNGINVHPNQINGWKKVVVDNVASLFA